MRLRRLDLIRYGRFEDVSLSLPDAALTVIHGPNEAGKSTALHAIDDLLFGFGHSTPFDYRFGPGALRLGAEIVARDGRVLAFRRRKGRVRTLLDETDAPMDDAALAPLLGGCTRALFHDLFGLDAARLRQGGAALLKDGGALGESLLSAGAALRDAGTLRRALEAEADALFTPRRNGGKAFWQAEARYQAARDALRAATRPPEMLAAAQAAAALAGERLAEARAALQALDAADRADRRLAACLPLLARLAALRAERAALAAPEAAPAGLGERLAAALADVEAARAGQARLAQAQAALAARRAQVPPPGPALAHRDAIAALQTQAGAAAAAAAERPGIEARRDATAQRLDAIATALGLSRAAFDALAPTAAALADARALLAEGVRLHDAATASAARAAALRRDLLDPAEGETAGADDADTAADWTPDRGPDLPRARAALERLRATPQRAQAAERLRAEAAAATAEAEAARRALTPPPRGDLAAMAVPALATVEAFAARHAALARQAAALEAEAAALARERAALDTGTADTAAVPDRAALDSARAARDAAWRGLRRAGLDAAPGPDAYEALVAEADRIADRREAGAAALEAAAQAAAGRRRLDTAAAALADRQAGHAAEAEALAAAWQRQWPGLAAPALPPEAMRDWLSARDRALGQTRQAAALTATAQQAVAAAQVEGGELDALAHSLGVGPQPSPAALVDALDRALDAAEGARDAARARAEAARQVAAARRETDAAEAACAAWRTRWHDTASALGLTPPPGLAGAAEALDRWTEALGLRETAQQYGARLAAIDAGAAAFATAAAALAAAVGLPAQPTPEAAARALAVAVETAIAAEAHHAACARDAADLTTEDTTLAAQAQRAVAAVAEAVGLAGAAADADPAALRDALLARDACDAAIAEQTARLREIDPAQDEAALREAAQALDPDTLAARIDTRAAEKEAAQAAHEVAIRAEAEATAALADHDDAGAANARQGQADAAAAMAEAAGAWLRLRAATVLLADATRRYREANSDPLLDAAGASLARMTGGALAGLAVTLDEADTERLVALRADGTPVKVEALSEGARDQLFLALRIAAIARRCAVAEPIPLVADDLFASFDDGRTAGGLAELARLGAATQVLVFTHHEAVAEAAARLGPQAAVLRLG